MSIVLCPFCQSRVALAADRECPSCRRIVAEGPLDWSAPPGNRFADVGDEVRDRSATNSVHENPYAAPRHLNYERRIAGANPRPGNLLRLLFFFQGRIPRRVYWGAYLSTTLFFYLGMFVLGAVFGEESTAAGVGFFALYLPMLWVFLAITVKRWHDRGKSGFWVLIGFIPIIGGIWQFIETGCLRGTVGPNEYGEDPTGDRLAIEFERLRNDAVSVWGEGEQSTAYAAAQIADRLEECPWCEAVVVRAGDTTCAQCDRPV